MNDSRREWLQTLLESVFSSMSFGEMFGLSTIIAIILVINRGLASALIWILAYVILWILVPVLAWVLRQWL